MLSVTQPPRFAAGITASVIVVVFAAMLILELRRPLRRSVESKFRRIVRNLTTGATALAVSTLLQTPLVVPISRWMLARHIGLLNMVAMPAALRTLLSVVLLDYSLWFWHYANHRVPFLWRFHLVHHVDRDLDASTALRFHFGEQALSVVYRCVQIAVIGATPLAVWTWQAILFASILFQHSNVELPIAWERRLVRFIVTPRMHGIHHSDRLNETNSNWSSLLSWWDYLHRTLILGVPQTSVTIGVPAYQSPSDVTIGRILVIPFIRQRRDFHLSDGSISKRSHEDVRDSLAN
ncbi:MAG TPA: sterol desaturase family protein [Thermoanaerobaculia bacterium]|nr:sterol desaturase family protein [Thermoanaerobaculia bacterium]